MTPVSRPGPAGVAWLERLRAGAARIPARNAFAAVFLVFLVIGFAQLALPGIDHPPVTGDSEKYHELAAGIEMLLQDPSLWGPLLRDELPPETRKALGIDRWEFQHAPAYTIPLGVAYALLPNNEGTGRSLSVIFYALSGGLLYLIGRRLVGPLWGAIPLGAYLLYLPMLFYATGILTEVFGVFALLLTSYVLLLWHRRPSAKRALCLGLACAFLYFAKTTFRPLVALILVAELVVTLRALRAAGATGATGSAGPTGPTGPTGSAGTAGPPGPESRRIRRVKPLRAVSLMVGVLVPVSLWYGGLVAAGVTPEGVSHSGESQLWLYRGNLVADQGWETTAMGDPITPIIDEAGARLRAAGGDEMDPDQRQRELYTRALWLSIRSDVFGWAALVAKKFHLFWTYPARKDHLETVLGDYVIPRGMHRVAYVLGLLGLAVLLRRSPELAWPGLLALGVAGLHALSHLVARYNVPVLPLWGLMATVGLRSLWIRLREGVAVWRSRGVDWLRPRRTWRVPLVWLAVAAAALAGGSFLLSVLPGDDPVTGRGLYVFGGLLVGLGIVATGPLMAACGARGGRGGTRDDEGHDDVRLGKRSLGKRSLGKRRLSGGRRRSAAYLALAPTILAIGVTGVILSERDWDQFAVRLERAGDAVVQRIPLGNPNLTRPDLFESAWLEIDMLQSLGGRFELEVWVQEQHVHTFTDSLGAVYESFLFDPAVHPAQGRYRRLAETLARFVHERSEPDYGVGFDYFRRWVRVPVPQELLGGDFLEVELRLTKATDGGWIRVYGDRFPGQGNERRIDQPAMGENPNEFSHYRAEFFAGDRERTDGRLIRPTLLRSPFATSLLRTKSQPRMDLGERYRTLRGELRVRLRVALVGVFVFREDEAGERQRTWTLSPRPEDEVLNPAEMRMFRWWRGEYFDGTWIY